MGCRCRGHIVIVVGIGDQSYQHIDPIALLDTIIRGYYLTMTEAQSVRHIEKSVLAWDRILLYFTRAECPECRGLGPRIGRLGQSFSDIEVLHIDLDRMPAAAGRYLIFDVPGAVLYLRGKPAARYTGGVDYAELRRILSETSQT